MRLAKGEVFEKLRRDYDALKSQNWGRIGWFDGWFKQPLNNARLSAVATYYEQVPELRALLMRCGDDFARFYAALDGAVTSDDYELPTDC